MPTLSVIGIAMILAVLLFGLFIAIRHRRNLGPHPPPDWPWDGIGAVLRIGMGVCAGGAAVLTTPQTSIAERLAMWTPVVVLGIVITRRDRRRRDLAHQGLRLRRGPHGLIQRANQRKAIDAATIEADFDVSLGL